MSEKDFKNHCAAILLSTAKGEQINAPHKRRDGVLADRRDGARVRRDRGRQVCLSAAQAAWHPRRVVVRTALSLRHASAGGIRAGVSVTTLMRWCDPYREELSRMGMQPRNRVLPPNIVQFIAEKFCIDV